MVLIKFIISVLYLIANLRIFKDSKFVFNYDNVLILGGGPSSAELKAHFENYDAIIAVGLSVEKLLTVRELIRAQKIYVIVAPFHKPQTYSDWEQWSRRVLVAAQQLPDCQVIVNYGVTTAYMRTLFSNLTQEIDVKVQFVYAIHTYYWLPFFEKYLKKFGYATSRYFSSASVTAVQYAAAHGACRVDLLGVDHTLALDMNELVAQASRSHIHSKEVVQDLPLRYIDELKHLANVNQEFYGILSSHDVDLRNLSKTSLIKVVEQTH